MAIEIYYFSGTGNSLAVAREIGSQIGGKVISISSLISKKRADTSDKIGIVFPAYMAQLNGVPLIVEDFVKKIQDIRKKSIFAVCTCGGREDYNALPAVKNLGKYVKKAGGRLHSEFIVRMPMNNCDYGFIPFPVEKDPETIINTSKTVINDICCRIRAGKREKNRSLKTVLNFFMKPLYAMLCGLYIAEIAKYSKVQKATRANYRELLHKTDRSITVNEKCDGCGICAIVCPAKNIRIQNKMPVWQGRCETCLACMEWCPKKAVQHFWRKPGVYYRHPSVKVKDMIVCL